MSKLFLLHELALNRSEALVFFHRLLDGSTYLGGDGS